MHHHPHIKSHKRRPNCPSGGPTTARGNQRLFGQLMSSQLRSSSLALMLVVLLVSGSEAIVKQTQSSVKQSRSDDSQSQAIQQSPQQQQQQHHQQQQQQQQQSAYQNHQSPQSQSQSSYSSSVSISGSSPSAVSASQSGSSSSIPSSGSVVIPSASAAAPSSQQNSQPQQVGRSEYSNYASNNNNGQSSSGPKSNYVDNLSAVASNPEHSYQAAANTVNMALASSGIYNSGYAPSMASGSGSQAAMSSPSASSGSSGSSGSSSGSSAQSLNPLHYFYYPPKESSAAAASQPKPVDIMNNAASNNYQTMAAYPSYADQLNSALSSLSGSGPEAAASNQDPSYLPQPSGIEGNQQQAGGSMYAPQQQQGSQQQQGPNGNQSPHQAYNSDLNSYASNLQPSQGSGGVSFNGPSSSGQNEYMNSHMGASGAGSGNQQMQPSGYQASSLYNQLGDLSTSNFGNNPGGLSSVASYMSPQQQVMPQQQQSQPQAVPQQHQSAHDIFSGSAGLQQFNSAASQLAPAAVSPPSPQQNGQSAGSSSGLFGSSLFGGQQASSGASAGSSGGLFGSGSHHYLNSYLTPQQYTQFTGQQLSSLDGSQMPQQGAQQPMASASSGSSAVASGSSKRFGISSFIMPMLALAGLSLLIPTMSNIGTAVGKRKKRSVEDRASAGNRQQSIAYDSMNGVSQLAKEHSIGEYMDKIERYYSIYKNAVENDDCLNRLICEFGDAVKDVTGKSAIVTVIEKLVPNWMVGKVHLFKEAALDNKEGKEKCKKYICHSNKYH